MMTLNQLSIGHMATIHVVEGANTIEQGGSSANTNSALFRLCDALGLLPGAPVKVLRRSRGNGPMQIKSMGTLYAIRSDEAEQIHVAVA